MDESLADEFRKPLDEPTYASIHRALLTGLLSNVGVKTESHEYAGTRSSKFAVFPGSSLFKSKPQWLMSFEIVLTSKLYARTNARIRIEWIESIAAHLLTRVYSEPQFSPATGSVSAFEKVSLFGLVLVPQRRVHYGPIDPVISREIFIRGGLVQRQLKTDAPFFHHNSRLIDDIIALEAKLRRRDILVDEDTRQRWYQTRIPEGIYTTSLLDRFRHDAERKNPRLLYMSQNDLIRPEAADLRSDEFPDEIRVPLHGGGRLAVKLVYHLDPGSEGDGVTAILPLAALNQVVDEAFEWLVPGMVGDKILALIRSLPKSTRVQFVPAPEHASRAKLALITPTAASQPAWPPDGSLYDRLVAWLNKTSAVPISISDFNLKDIANHFQMTFRVVDEKGTPVPVPKVAIDAALAAGSDPAAALRDLAALRRLLGMAAQQEFASAASQDAFTKPEVREWNFGDLPDQVQVRRKGMMLVGYPGLADSGEGKWPALKLHDSLAAATIAHHQGTRRLIIQKLGSEVRYLTKSLPNEVAMSAHYAPLGPGSRLREQIVAAAVDEAYLRGRPPVRKATEFAVRMATSFTDLSKAASAIARTADAVLLSRARCVEILDRLIAPAFAVSVGDVRQQLAGLVGPDFVLATPTLWLPHVPRFMKAIETRLQKLTNSGLARDAAVMRDLSPLLEAYRVKLVGLQKRNDAAAALEEMSRLRWLIEELRVSLFAQELKTSTPVSLKRVGESLAAVR